MWVYAFCGKLNKIEQAGLITAGIMIIINGVFDYQFVEISADKQFRLISAVNYRRSLIAVILNAALIYYLSIYGLYIAAIVSVAIMIIYMHKMSPLTLKLVEPFKKAVFISLAKRACPY